MPQIQQLEEFSSGQIWVKHIPFNYLGANIGARMTVIKLSNQRLLLHSPVKLTPELISQLDALGRVCYVVSPNSLHHLFIHEYVAQYPQARYFAPPGLASKRKDLNFQFTLQDEAEEEWKMEVQQFIFWGRDDFQEVVFYHPLSRTLILGDLLMNIDQHCSMTAKIMAMTMKIYNKPTPPIDFEVGGIEFARIKSSVDRILLWTFDKIILSHGSLIRSDGRKVFKNAFSWLDNGAEQRRGSG